VGRGETGEWVFRYEWCVIINGDGSRLLGVDPSRDIRLVFCS